MNLIHFCACAALEILPLLAFVRNKKSVVAYQFLYYPKDGLVSQQDVLRETINRPTFILHNGDPFHVVVDNEVLLTSSISSEALLNVFGCYYNSLKWCPKLLGC
uniref:Uncharacterized protein n=1 Tax=Daphnia galeata TaxID=27404 RepID=A0A8J2RS04_9CRUS|nr:unnamed protein product [Daphnia galeata]